MANKSNFVQSVFTSLIIFGASQSVIAEQVYQWLDEEGVVNFSDIASEETMAMVTYESPILKTAYQWKDGEGNIHFADIAPSDISISELREVKTGGFDINDAKQEEYSIIKQAERMAALRKQIEDERLEMKRKKLEERQIAQELEVIRLNEQIRTQGYGPRPYYYPYSQPYY